MWFALYSFAVGASVVLPDPIHISFVACQATTESIDVNRTSEALSMIKSVLLTTSDPRRLRFHIFADDEVGGRISNALRGTYVWHRVYSTDAPSSEASGGYKMIERGKPCAGLKLSLPSMLPANVTAVLNVDTDILFLRDVTGLWNYLQSFNSTQLAALAQETETEGPWYGTHEKCKAPFYQPYGLNSGVMLLNLTRCRALGWSDRLAEYSKQYTTGIQAIKWGDQDLLNILFHFNRELIFQLPCHWNYRPDLCMDWTRTPTSSSKDADEWGGPQVSSCGLYNPDSPHPNAVGSGTHGEQNIATVVDGVISNQGRPQGLVSLLHGNRKVS
jgi:UDP-xylose:glucoside alpha-1,3-xylosyltransferase